jgi:hypothetical protein
MGLVLFFSSVSAYHYVVVVHVCIYACAQRYVDTDINIHTYVRTIHQSSYLHSTFGPTMVLVEKTKKSAEKVAHEKTIQVSPSPKNSFLYFIAKILMLSLFFVGAKYYWTF